jgi:hypothetical protein
VISFWQVLILIGILSIAILLGVALGAYSVFRTKREPHETFTGTPRKGEVFSIDNICEPEGEWTPKEGEWSPPDEVLKKSMSFLDQFTNGGG